MANGHQDTYPQIIELAKKSGIPFTVSSTLRPGSTGSGGGLDHHNYGEAVDFGGYSQDALADYFMGLHPTEEIHHSDKSGKDWAIFDGQPGDANANRSLLNEHRNHLHVAFTAADLAKAGQGGPVSGASGGGPLDAIAEPFRILGKMATYLMSREGRMAIAIFLIGAFLIWIGAVELTGAGIKGTLKKAVGFGGSK